MNDDRPVLSYHLILSAYGFWLPNDPRGSWSEIVRSSHLREFGPATKVDTHRSVARRTHDRGRRLAAKQVLDYPPVRFDGLQARAVARGFRQYVERSGVTIWACAVMPDHAHLVVARHRYDIETVGNLIKGEATKRLVEEHRHPFLYDQRPDGSVPPCFARKWWAVFLWDETDIVRSIRYVENNPVKEGYQRQTWRCVTPDPERYEPKKTGG